MVQNTCFKGYIHKFSTTKPFFYSLEVIIQDYLYMLLKDSDLLRYGRFVKEIVTEISSNFKEYSLRDVCTKFNMDFSDTIIKDQANGYSLYTPFMKFLVLCYRFEIDPNEIFDKIFKKTIENGLSIEEFYVFIGVHWMEISDEPKEYKNLLIPQTGSKDTIKIKIPKYDTLTSPNYLNQIRQIVYKCKSEYLCV